MTFRKIQAKNIDVLIQLENTKYLWTDVWYQIKYMKDLWD
jgi:hypothetical protein